MRTLDAIRERLQVEAADAGARLDRWLTDRLQELEYTVSRSQVQAWIRAGHVRRDSAPPRPSDAVGAGETYEVAVPAPEPIALLGDKMDIAVVYEDEDVVVVNKERGVVVHPAPGHLRHTLVNGLIARGTPLSSLGGGLRPGVVHRIDKDTSGLVMFAKSDLAYHSLTQQLREHTTHRVYEAIVHGILAHDEGRIDAPIGRDPRNRQRMAVTGGGKPAVTDFRVRQRFAGYTYVQLRLSTGRTHQIRVHMAYIGHPLAGDPLYGPRHTLPIAGQALHARELGFVHPRTGEALRFASDLPADMQHLVDGLAAGLW
ncbi:RluA family pseudouridine synthase [Alicyclobacillus kakegawensis]|uniref:RluA family pseudouridine synthase n=1 Tax=Alicyclobacillus kakegawensis TaxID=392012 RepID=UPI000B100A67|nr:RluA family pseudouridine synthase [Alicyclobacillus kakegawensis]